MSTEQHYLEPRGSGGWSWSHRRDRDEPAPGGDAGEYTDADEYDAPVYVISVAADLAGLHPQTLRAYEREGLLTPARTEGGTRRYSRRDVDRLRFIRTLTQDEGLNIAGVRVVLEMGEKLEGARRRISELEDMVRALAERIDQRPAGDRVEIVKSAPAHVEAHPTLRRRTGQRSARVTDARTVPPRRTRSV
jgi:MerR family transcriptional regulator, heat shock protein HspR